MANYNNMKLTELKRLGKERGLLGIDLNNKRELIERLQKGKQLSDFSKNELLEQSKNSGILVNATMGKKTLLDKIQKPKAQDLSDARLRQIAKDEGVKLRGNMTRKEIIKRIENPTPHYTLESLKRLAAARNIELKKGINKTELLNLLGERGIVRERKQIEVAPLAVERQIKDLETIRRIKKQPRTKREALLRYKSYIKNIKKENLSSIRLKEIVKTLERKEREAREERGRILVAKEGLSAFKAFAKVFIIRDEESVYDNSFDFLNDASDTMVPILRRNKSTKVKLVFRCKMVLDTGENGGEMRRYILREFAFSSAIELNLQSTDEDELYQQMIDLIEERIQGQTLTDSGWSFHSVVQLELHIVEYQPLRGGSYIALPPFIKNKKVVINMKNDD